MKELCRACGNHILICEGEIRCLTGSYAGARARQRYRMARGAARCRTALRDPNPTHADGAVAGRAMLRQRTGAAGRCSMFTRSAVGAIGEAISIAMRMIHRQANCLGLVGPWLTISEHSVSAGLSACCALFERAHVRTVGGGRTSLRWRPNMDHEPDRSGNRVVVPKRELIAMVDEVVRCPDGETGGSLFGYWTHDGTPVIVWATPPGSGRSLRWRALGSTLTMCAPPQRLSPIAVRQSTWGVGIATIGGKHTVPAW